MLNDTVFREADTNGPKEPKEHGIFIFHYYYIKD